MPQVETDTSNQPFCRGARNTIPCVSVLMPVRNEENFLPAALASLRRQTLTDWELVAVDDGSIDATPDLLAAAARGDRRIRILSRPAQGLVAALNTGLAACRASLVARLDGDDICHPRRLEKQLDFLRRHPEIGVLGCDVRHFPRPALPAGMHAYEAWQNTLHSDTEIRRDLFVESPLTHPSVMYRRDLVLAAGGYRETGWAEDYDLWLLLAAAGTRFARLPETLFFWRDRPQRFTRTSPTSSLAAFRACKAHHLKNGYLRGVDSVTLWGAGIEGKAWRQALLAEGITVDRWLEVDQRKIGQTIHGAPVLPLAQLRPGCGPVLVTVGARQAKPQIRAWAAETGLAEGRDFICVT